MNKQKWLSLVQILTPIALGIINPALAPLGALIAHGIGTAQDLPGATGPQKLAYVQDLVNTGAQGINAVAAGKGHPPIVDVGMVNQTGAATISAIVDAVNLIHTTGNALDKLPTAPPANMGAGTATAPPPLGVGSTGPLTAPQWPDGAPAPVAGEGSAGGSTSTPTE